MINMISWQLAARTLSGLFVATVAVAGSQAQGTVAYATSKGTPIKSEVQLVLLGVVVTSGNGRPVGGLRKDDFQVAEDGHPQTISFFEVHTGTAAIIVSLPPMPPNVFTNYPCPQASRASSYPVAATVGVSKANPVPPSNFPQPKGSAFHALRHGRVSVLREAGVPDDIVMKWAGHSNLRITDHYTHRGAGALSELAEKVSGLSQLSQVVPIGSLQKPSQAA